MGLAYRVMGRNVEALTHFESFIKDAIDVPAEKRQEASELVSELRAKVATLSLDVTPAGANVSVDGKPVGRSPVVAPVYVETGPHKVIAELAGAHAVVRDISATAGGTLSVRIDVGPQTTPPPPPDPVAKNADEMGGAAPQPVAWQRPAKWAAAGLAVVAVGLGIVETLVAMNKASEFNSSPAHCMDDGHGRIFPLSPCAQIDQDQSTATHVAIAGYVTGAVLAGAAAFLQFRAGARDSAKTIDTALITCGPLGLNHGGAVCSVRW
jgi:hypothetical protein